MLVLLYLLPRHPPPHAEETVSKGSANLPFSFVLQKACYIACLFCFCVHSTMEKNVSDDVWYLGTICRLWARGWYFPQIIRFLDTLTSPIQSAHPEKSTWQNRRGYAIKNLGDKERVEKVWNCLQEQSAKQRQLPCFVAKISKHNRSWSPYASVNHHKHKLEHAVGEMNWSFTRENTYSLNGCPQEGFNLGKKGCWVWIE